jgi:hypothetical protein
MLHGVRPFPEREGAFMPHIALEIHDSVLIAAAFCMFNRYVDGLATIAPQDPALYAGRAERIVADGYLALLAESQREG